MSTSSGPQSSLLVLISLFFSSVVGPIYDGCGLTMAKCPPGCALSLPFLSRLGGENNMKKSLMVRINTGRSLTNYCHRQSSFHLEKKIFITKPEWVVRKKPSLYLFFFFQAHLHSQLLYLFSPDWCRRWEMGSYSQPTTGSLYELQPFMNFSAMVSLQTAGEHRSPPWSSLGGISALAPAASPSSLTLRCHHLHRIIAS